MRKQVFYLFMFCSVTIYAQKGITFQVEELSSPRKYLRQNLMRKSIPVSYCQIPDIIRINDTIVQGKLS